MEIVDSKNATKIRSLIACLVTEASTIGISVGKFPRFLVTTVGNQQPFVLEYVDEDLTAHYKQDLGIIRLKVFND